MGDLLRLTELADFFLPTQKSEANQAAAICLWSTQVLSLESTNSRAVFASLRQSHCMKLQCHLSLQVNKYHATKSTSNRTLAAD